MIIPKCVFVYFCVLHLRPGGSLCEYSSWYIWFTPATREQGQKSPISAPSRTTTPAVAGCGVPAHRTSAGGTQGTRVSAAIQLASSEVPLADRDRVMCPKSESCPMDDDMERRGLLLGTAPHTGLELRPTASDQAQACSRLHRRA